MYENAEAELKRINDLVASCPEPHRLRAFEILLQGYVQSMATCVRPGAAPGDMKPQEATLYRAAISFGTTETQLVWTRYAGFIVMNGFLINVLAQRLTSSDSEYAALFMAIGGLGLFLNAVWHVLNFSGWLNQNVFYHQSYDLFLRQIGLVTDQFQALRRPFGWIYWIAQSIPTVLSLMAVACLASGLAQSMESSWYIWLWSSLLWVVVACVVLAVEYGPVWSSASNAGGGARAV